MKECIHFAHGNGFPALSYQQMLSALAVQYDYCYIDRIGHHSKFPVTENWHYLVDELLDSVQRQSNRPVIALGHSLGGVLSLIAAIERPELFKAVIMLDSPLLGRFKSSMVRLAKALGVIDRITPAHRTKGRREHWQDKQHLMQYLKTRELFKHFDEACLEDYIDHGMEKHADGYYLRFDKHIEYQIYRTIPHILPKFEGKLKIPAALIYGDKSTVVDTIDVRYMKKYFGIRCFEMKGSHVFPFESPQLTAQKIIAVAGDILNI